MGTPAKILLASLAILCLGLAFSCVNNPPPDPVPVEPPLSGSPDPKPPVADPTPPPSLPPENPPPQPVTNPDPAPFDANQISAEQKQSTIIDIRKFIEELNAVIQRKDFETWSTHLTEAYRVFYSRPEVLAELSNQFVIKRQGIVLKSLKDYFLHVVYPSRQNDTVDDIEYIGQTKIKAFVITPKGDRLVLYILEKIGDTWKISRQ